MRRTKKMKKWRIAVPAIIAAMTFAACGGSSEKTGSADPGRTSAKSLTDESARIVLICDPVGTNPFLTQMVDGLNEVKQTYPGLTTSVVECPDAGVWEDNIRAAVQEGWDMIITAGGQAVEPISAVADEFPHDAKYVMVDAVSPSSNVKSISFREQEGAYLIGMIAAYVNTANKFGAVHANEGPGSWKWRWGYMQGAAAVRPELTRDNFIFNFTASYTDAAKAKELALQQAAAGCGFINAASAVADFGTFEAALEKHFYTSGQDADRTNPANPYIITTQIKDTSVVIKILVEEYMSGKLDMKAVSYGVKEGVIGALYITHDGKNPRNTQVLTDDIVTNVKAAAGKIASGEIVLDLPPAR
jgi:basic membrane protein A